MVFTEVAFLSIFTVFAVSSLSYIFQYEDTARKTALFGFGALFIISIILTIVFAIQGIFHIWFFGVNMGILLMFNAFARVWYNEPVSPKLTHMTTVFIAFLMPFYTISTETRPILQEFIASHFYVYLDAIGLSVRLVEHENGLLTRLVFDNGGFLFINWACVGLEFAALFAAFSLISDEPIQKKTIGVILSIVTVYAANMSRLVFTGYVLANDLIGPLFTSENTLQMSYHLSEAYISQIFTVVIASLFFLFILKLLPDVRKVSDGFLDLHPKHEAYLKQKIDEL